METPSELRYTKDHEWIRVENGECVIGITDYAQDALGDVVFVQPPEVGRSVSPGDVLCEVESTKSVSEVYAPIAGEIIAVNEALSSSPDQLNSSPYANGWICRISPKDIGEVDSLMSPDDYRGITET